MLEIGLRILQRKKFRFPPISVSFTTVNFRALENSLPFKHHTFKSRFKLGIPLGNSLQNIILLTVNEHIHFYATDINIYIIDCSIEIASVLRTEDRFYYYYY